MHSVVVSASNDYTNIHTDKNPFRPQGQDLCAAQTQVPST